MSEEPRYFGVALRLDVDLVLFCPCRLLTPRILASFAKGWYLEAESYLATTSRLLAGLRLDKIHLRIRSAPGEAFVLVLVLVLVLSGSIIRWTTTYQTYHTVAYTLSWRLLPGAFAFGAPSAPPRPTLAALSSSC